MITEDYVSFEVAKLLKEKGFDEKCRSYYIGSSGRYSRCTVEIKTNDCRNDEILRPTHQMVLKWLREEHNLIISINFSYVSNSYTYLIKYITRHEMVWSDIAESYEEVVEAALKYTLENLI